MNETRFTSLPSKGGMPNFIIFNPLASVDRDGDDSSLTDRVIPSAIGAKFRPLHRMYDAAPSWSGRFLAPPPPVAAYAPARRVWTPRIPRAAMWRLDRSPIGARPVARRRSGPRVAARVVVARGDAFSRAIAPARRVGARALARGPLAPRRSPRFVVVARAERGDARDGDDARAEGDDARAEGSDAPEDARSDASSSSSSSSSTTSSLGWSDVGPGLVPSVATACLGAFLFGYHSAVINAPLSAISEDLGFAGDNVRKGVVVSVLVAGGFLGGLGIGPFADKEGRRAALAATTVPLAAGTLISAGADSFEAMTLGRLITGVGVGASSQIVPLYLSEVSPPELRGTVNGIRRVAYVVGCLLAFQFAVPLQRAPEGMIVAEGAAATASEAPAERRTTRSSGEDTSAARVTEKAKSTKEGASSAAAATKESGGAAAEAGPTTRDDEGGDAAGSSAEGGAQGGAQGGADGSAAARRVAAGDARVAPEVSAAAKAASPPSAPPSSGESAEKRKSASAAPAAAPAASQAASQAAAPARRRRETPAPSASAASPPAPAPGSASPSSSSAPTSEAAASLEASAEARIAEKTAAKRRPADGEGALSEGLRAATAAVEATELSPPGAASATSGDRAASNAAATAGGIEGIAGEALEGGSGATAGNTSAKGAAEKGVAAAAGVARSSDSAAAADATAERERERRRRGDGGGGGAA